ncbi:LacI family DNA-binding transcriptional regulator [Bauldia litoralis]|uniref:LacI family transcriptional regulator n=1 Tax=Bauldia litoralis TaxID=665467 RepID=A0A1G6CFY9_9HYPH|nr:LacI family DNA-binding transcriptional regulator [Bauldia litoralis]SDB31789.1 LacI family transcriptional regulator [Bauldia litoralis]
MARTTLQDVAKTAGVSLATVDRVLNRRAGVHADTAERVQQAIERLKYRPDRLAARLARGRDHRFEFILPSGSNAFMRALEERVRVTADHVVDERVRIGITHVDVFDGEVLAAALDNLRGEADGVAVVALDHPSVCEAIDDLTQSGVTVVTLVSDAPRSKRAHYVGIDNTAAGRTAASLLGRFLGGRGGKVGLIAGSMALRDHIERQIGFEQVIARDFPGLRLLPIREGRDDDERVEALAAALLGEHDDLVGIYNVGAGNGGVVAALEASGRSRDVVFVAHELTPFSRRHLIRGTIDAIINQDAGHEGRSATRLLIAEREGIPIDAGQERIRIDIFVRDNVP